jgi:hypothetical protein
LANAFEQFSDVVTKLQNAVDRPKDEYIRDSVIQRFEFCVELACLGEFRLKLCPPSVELVHRSLS